MSFAGIFRAENGIVALVDSKATDESQDRKKQECIGRNPEKMFVFSDGILLVYGALQVYKGHKGVNDTEMVFIEMIIREYLAKHKRIDAGFFQELLLKMNTSKRNQKPVYFIVGRKIWAGKYQVEYHKVGYDYYAMKIGDPKEICFPGGSDLYVQAFREMNYGSMIHSVENLQKFVSEKLQEMIDFFDHTLEYNPVGGIVKAYILK